MGLTIFLTTTFTHKMAKNMKEKYQKYCGDPNKLNILLLIVVVLAPRSKVKYINWAIDQLFDVDKAHGSKSRLKSSLKSLLNENNGHKEGTQDDTQQAHINVPSYKKNPYSWNLFLQTSGLTSSNKSELQKN